MAPPPLIRRPLASLVQIGNPSTTNLAPPCSYVPRETSMRPQVLLVTLAVLVVLAALPLITKGSEEEEGAAVVADDYAANARSWPCCNNCGMCNRKNPPECQCMDISYQNCHAACRSCIKYIPARGSWKHESPIYRCADMLTNFCRSRCTPTAAVAI